MLLENHIAAVTGAGSGIGRAIAIGYAREGARVVVLDVNGDAASETVQQILNAGGNAQAYALDVTDREACRVIATNRRFRSAPSGSASAFRYRVS